MAATTINKNTYEQVYNLSEDEGLYSRVGLVICILVQRGILVAGFSISRELLTLHYTGYNKNRPVWDINFFEHLFSQEPLLTVREKVKGVFTCSNRNMIIPDSLYDEAEAKKWMRQIHFIEKKDIIESYHLEDDKANYVQAMPLSITELIKINFKKSVVLPMPIYQFSNTNKQSLYLQCCITGDQVCGTLHNYSQLLWHKVFDYVCAEDIAYEIRQLCIENNISPSKISLRCNALTAAEFDVVNELSQYFPGLRAGNGRSISAKWDAAIYLAQQLYACVS